MAARRSRAELVLASGSPRRHRLLDDAGIFHEVFPVEVDEAFPANCGPSHSAVTLAVRKAFRAGELRPDSAILTADTIVALDSRLFGKPVDAGHAREMLRDLSGREHRVITGVCLHTRRGGRTLCRAVTTVVVFRSLSVEDIDIYVASGEPFDKAGGYAIQGAAGEFVLRIDGPFDNVVGLPVGAVKDMLVQW